MMKRYRSTLGFFLALALTITTVFPLSLTPAYAEEITADEVVAELSGNEISDAEAVAELSGNEISDAEAVAELSGNEISDAEITEVTTEEDEADEAVAASSKATKLTIYHTNDMHGHVEDLAYVKALDESTENSLLLDAGDPTQGTALASYSKGSSIIKLMNNAGYDAMTTGNHEYDYGTANLRTNIQTAEFPVLAANVYEKNGDLLTGAKKHIVTTLDGGEKVGIFGLATVETSTKANPSKLDGITFKDVIETATEEVAALKSLNCDAIICIAHVGNDSSSDPISDDLAKAVAGIDVIVDGHSHTEEQQVVSGCKIVQTGNNLSKLGKVELSFNDEGALANVSSELLELSDIKNTLAPDSDYQKLYDELYSPISEELDVVAVHSATPVYAFANNGKVKVSRSEETPLGDLVTDSMVWSAKNLLKNLGSSYAKLPVVALENGGGIRADLPEGDIKKSDILNVLPFGNILTIKEITPDVLYETLERGYKYVAINENGYVVLSGDGGFAQISGMKVVIDANAAEGSKVTAIYLGNSTKALSRTDKKTKIALASNDFTIAGGDAYKMLGSLPTLAGGDGLDTILTDYLIELADGKTLPCITTSERILVSQIAEQQLPQIDFVLGSSESSATYSVDGKEAVTLEPVEGQLVYKNISRGMHLFKTNDTYSYVSSFTGTGLTNYYSGTSLKDASVTINVAAATYTGKELTPAVTVKYGKKTLKEGVDYELTWANNINVAPADTDQPSPTVTITGKGNFRASVAKTFIINPKKLTKVTYDSIPTQKSDKANVSAALEQIESLLNVYENKTKLNSADFKLSKINGKESSEWSNIAIAADNITKLTLTVEGTGNYTGLASKSIVLTIDNRTDTIDLTAPAKVSLSEIPAMTYTGKALTPSVTLTNLETNKKLKAGKDYKVTCTDNINAGENTAYIRIDGYGKYVGTIKTTFTINKATISKVTILNVKTKTINPEAPEAEIQQDNIVVKAGKQTLEEGTDYTLEYKNNTKVSTKKSKATVSVNISPTSPNFKVADNTKCIGTKSFTIKPFKLTAKNTIIGLVPSSPGPDGKWYYEGDGKNAVKPTIEVYYIKDTTKNKNKLTIDDLILLDDKYFDPTYDQKNVAFGKTATIKLKAKDAFTGKLSVKVIIDDHPTM